MNDSRLFNGRRPTGTFWVVAVVVAIFLTGGIYAVANQPADTTAAASSRGKDAKAADTWTCTGCRTSEPTNSGTPVDPVVASEVPDASSDIATAISTMRDLGFKPVVLDASGQDVTYLFDSLSGSGSVFVSQEPAAHARADEGSTVTVHVRDPKVVVSADFSGPGGTITMLDGASFSQVTGAPQHWEKEVPYGDSTKYTFTNPYAAGTLTCNITQEGEVLQTNTASGAFASANC